MGDISSQQVITLAREKEREIYFDIYLHFREVVD